MRNLALYIVQVIIASGILYGYYHLFLRNNRFHVYNRFYLLGSVIVSLLLPLLSIPVYFNSTENIPVLFKVLDEVRVGNGTPPNSSTGVSINNILAMIYWAIASLLVLRIVLSILRLKKVIDKNKVTRINKIYLVNTSEPNTPYSFFNWMFWNRRIELESKEGRQVFNHEYFHIKQKHSWDILCIEVLCSIFWVIPFFHFAKKELKAIHEFLADQYATREADSLGYAELLLKEALQTRQQLVNPFFHNQIKRRIAMITNSSNPQFQYLRKLLALPAIALAITVVAIQCKSKDELKQPPEKETESVKIDLVPKDTSTQATPQVEDIKISEVPAENKIYEKVEIEAMFPGGVNAWRTFLVQKLNAMVPLDNGAPEGQYTVFVQFIVDQKGRISDLKPITKLGYGMEDEVIRVMKQSPNWSPAINNGKTVKAYRKQPVTFAVTAE